MKKSWIYYSLFFLLFGWLLGFHRFYLGPRFNRSAVLYLLTFGMCGIWMVLDLFRGPKLVSKANEVLQ